MTDIDDALYRRAETHGFTIVRQSAGRYLIYGAGDKLLLEEVSRSIVTDFIDEYECDHG